MLARLGVLDDLRSRAVEPQEVLIRRGRDGAALARFPLGAAAAARYGAPFLVTLRADLQAALLARIALRPAVALHLGRGVTGYEPRGRGVALRFADPRQPSAAADGLVAADGLHSEILRYVAPGAKVGLRASGRSAWRSLVPREAAPADALAARSNLWLGRRAHLVHYPVGAGDLVNVVAIVDDAAEGRAGPSWSEPAEAGTVERRFADWAPPARHLIAAALAWRRWPLFDRAPIRRWSNGPVTLLGDAAHPMLPFLAQGAAQSIEDAAVLADAVAQSPGDLSAAFRAYATVRAPRTARVQVVSRRQGVVYHLGRPASDMRDLVLSKLGPDRLAARLDWLYEPPAEIRRFARL